MTPIPLVHQTDLFRPHQDPDDHWDLLCVHALHQTGAVEAEAVLIDHPPPHHGGGPDRPAIDMLSTLTGVRPRVAKGSADPFATTGSEATSEAADLLTQVLESSPQPVLINIAGSCRDVALALRSRPDLFEDNCKAICLNAGTGYAASEIDDEIEYNVKLDVKAFSFLLDAPCRVLWCPCFERLGVGLKVHTHGTWFTFTQRDLLELMPQPLRGYLAYMYSRDMDPDWVRWLDSSLSGPVIDQQLDVQRPMWTTAGLLYATGYLGLEGFTFEPVEVRCRPNGTTTWKPGNQDSNVMKFRITNHRVYAVTVRSALRDLIVGMNLVAAG